MKRVLDLLTIEETESREPDNAKDILTAFDRGFVGYEKPRVEHVNEPDPDPSYYRRKKAAQKLGVDEDELEDEPDERLEDYDNFKEAR